MGVCLTASGEQANFEFTVFHQRNLGGIILIESNKIQKRERSTVESGATLVVSREKGREGLEMTQAGFVAGDPAIP